MFQVKERVWQERNGDDQKAYSLSSSLKVSQFIARLLTRRGINEAEEAEVFLNPSLKHFKDPFSISENVKAAERIFRALKNRELICIYGDYDADGLCGTALLYEFLLYHGANLTVFIPHRIRDGYGFHPEAVVKLKQKGVKVIITVDCGIASFETCEVAKKKGIDVIITDHHLPSKRIPPCYAVISPHLPDSGFSWNNLSGAGVAFYLVMGLRKFFREKGIYKEIDEPNLRNFLDLVAVATVVDVAPLTGENRVIVKKGIEVFKEMRREGFRAILTETGLKPERVNTFHLSFIIGPRLNAAGRVSDPLIALELLLTKNPATAGGLAKNLNEKNQIRQGIERDIFEEAMKMALALPEEYKGIFLFSERWHPGVIGIVASRLAEAFNRPVILGAKDNGFIRCSARSVPSIHITALLKSLSVEPESIGGHESAAGLVIREELAEEFKMCFLNKLEEFEITPPVVQYDFELSPAHLSVEEVNSLQLLEPFGEGNPEPVFLARDVMLMSPREGRRGYVYTLYDSKKIFTLFSDTPLKAGKGDLLYTPFVANTEAGDIIFLRKVDWRPY